VNNYNKAKIENITKEIALVVLNKTKKDMSGKNVIIKFKNGMKFKGIIK